MDVFPTEESPKSTTFYFVGKAKLFYPFIMHNQAIKKNKKFKFYIKIIIFKIIMKKNFVDNSTQ